MVKTARVIVCALAMAVGAAGAHATVFTYTTFMSGDQEDTPNTSPGTGTATVEYDDVAHTLSLDVSFTGLESPTTNAHIHATTAAPFTGIAGVATTTPTFSGFPSGVTSGVYVNTLDLTLASSYNATFVTNNGGTVASAEAALAAAMASGRAYLNIHSNMYTGGEIRGFLPEPATGSLLLAVTAVLARRRGGVRP